MNIQHFFDSFPGLNLEDIMLREIELSDARDYYQYMSNRRMNSYLTVDNQPKTIDQAEKELLYWRNLFHQKKSIYWAIACKKNNQMLGTAGFNNISFVNARAEISYDLNPDYWGKGVMTKAIKGILQFADIGLEIIRIQATVIVNNLRSIKLLERSGFQQEGLLKKYEVVEGVHKDYYVYGRINDSID